MAALMTASSSSTPSILDLKSGRVSDRFMAFRYLQRNVVQATAHNRTLTDAWAAGFLALPLWWPAPHVSMCMLLQLCVTRLAMRNVRRPGGMSLVPTSWRSLTPDCQRAGLTAACT
jgi:hypothetical protein